METCLIIFAKEPDKAFVKTRLASTVGGRERLKIYKAFLKDTIKLAQKVNADQGIIAYDSKSKRPSYIESIADSFALYEQKGRDLGDRMNNAFEYAESLGFSKTVIIGSDSPNLPATFIKKAFDKLNTYDFVIGPSKDGGYYLIGTKQPSSKLFEGIKWSSDSVLNNTIKNARRLDKKVYLLHLWYDVDTPQNLEFLKSDLRGKGNSSAVFTREALGV